MVSSMVPVKMNPDSEYAFDRQTQQYFTYDNAGVYVSLDISSQSIKTDFSKQDEYGNVFRNGGRDPSTPHSNRSSDGIRTRSGRSTTRRADSPFSTTKSRVSKSPMPARREKKAKMDKSKMPKLTAPLSVLTKDMNVPMKDIEEWVNRSLEARREEVEKRNGYVTRPMNSFMLYRSAFADRTKQWCLKNNHQVVSSVSGESWPMEPPEVRDKFNEWAKIERTNHAAAHPNYKFSPSKTNNKKRKGEETDEDDGSIDFDDPDGEYRGPKNTRQRKQPPGPAYLPSNHGYEASPYYDSHHSDYDTPQYQFVTNVARPLPSNASYDPYMRMSPQNNNHVQLAVQAPTHFQYTPDMIARGPSPQTLGGYGLPGSARPEEIFAPPRDDTTLQPFTQYGQQAYTYSHRLPASLPSTQVDNHQLLAMHGHHTVDPGLDITFTSAGEVTAAPMHIMPVESHFDNAFADYDSEYAYLDHPQHGSSVDTTLAPTWSPTEATR